MTPGQRHRILEMHKAHYSYGSIAIRLKLTVTEVRLVLETEHPALRQQRLIRQANTPNVIFAGLPYRWRER